MTFGRWLLIHSFSIFLVTMLILGYIYREELQLEQAYQQLLNIESDNLPLPDKPAAAKPEPTITAETPELTPQPTLEPKPTESTLSSEKPVESEISVSTIETENVPTLPEAEIFPDDTWLMARMAYRDKNYTQAIRLYQQLIEQDSGNPDFYGELGDIYYLLNDDQNASRAYYQAALILIQQNQIQHAARLLSPITAMNRSLGDQLSRRLQQSTRPNR